MRNNTAETHQTSIDQPVRGFAKFRSQTIGKDFLGAIKEKIEDDSSAKKSRESQKTKAKQILESKSNKSGTIYAEISHSNQPRLNVEKDSNVDTAVSMKHLKDSIHESKMKFLNAEVKVPRLNEDCIKKLYSVTSFSKTNNNFDSKKCNSIDSRITGGGINKIENKPTNNTRNLLKNFELKKDLCTKKTFESNISPVVSFKTKNTIRKPALCTKQSVNSTKVALLTQKFNDIIKENNTKIDSLDVQKNVDDEKLIEKNNKPTKDIEIISQNKLYPNIILMERNSKPRSPLVHKKVFRVKSDPKRKNSTKKRFNDGMSSMSSDKSDNDNIDGKVEVYEIKKNYAKRGPSFKTSPTRHVIGVVRATVQKFESESPMHSEPKSPQRKNIISDIEEQKVYLLSDAKPKIPEKKLNVIRTKNLVMKEGKPKIKVLRKNLFEHKKTETKNENVQDEVEKPLEISSENNSNDETKCANELSSNISMNEEKPLAANTIIPIDQTNLIGTSSKKNSKLKEKSFYYDKIPIYKLFTNKKLQLPANETAVPISSISDSNIADKVCENAPEPSISPANNENAIIESEQKCSSVSCNIICENIKDTKIIPNTSFLWRTNSSNLLKEKCSCNVDNMYETFNSSESNDIDINSNSALEVLTTPKSTAVDCSETVRDLTVDNWVIISNSDTEDYGKCSDYLNKISSNVSIVEAVNMSAISDTFNIRNEIALLCPPDEYETFETYRDEEVTEKPMESIGKAFHSKANCPLPELPDLPKEKEENIYQCLSELHLNFGNDDSSKYNYEYFQDSTEIVKNSGDDGYEYCKSPKSIHSKSSVSPIKSNSENKNGYIVSKSDSITSSIGYEKISSIYERIFDKPGADLNKVDQNKDLNYYDCNYDDNIYDTIKHCDTASISNCYESISESPHYKIKTKHKIDLPILLAKHKSFDTISNFSHSTISSDQKTNSIYEQRSISGFDKTNSIMYGKCPSEITLSDRSEDWEDISDQDNTTIIIVREKSKGKHSPASWSRKVRHQWNDAGKLELNSDFFVSSSSIVYLTTHNDAETKYCQNTELVFRLDCDELRWQDVWGLAALKVLVLDDCAFETQEITVLIDSSDGEHIYEPLSHPNQPCEKFASEQIDDDFDSFESYSESDDSSENNKPPDKNKLEIDITNTQLPDPPTSSNSSYTLTQFGTIVGKKMLQFKNNLTKSTRKKSIIENPKSPTTESKSLFTLSKNKKNGILNENVNRPIYENVVNDKKDAPRLLPNKIESPISNENSQTSIECDSSNNSSFEKNDKALRNPYLSFKSKFKRSMSTSNNRKSNPTLSSISNSTFYLDSEIKAHSETNLLRSNNDSILDVSQENENLVTSCTSEEQINNNSNLQDDKTVIFKISSENIQAVELRTNSNKTKRFSINRPTVAPPSPPTDVKKDKKDKRVINTASWYAECGLFKEAYKPESNGNIKNKSSSSWYAEIGLYQASNVSTSSGTSSTLSGSGTCSTTTAFSSPSTPTPPLGMFNQECLYQFYDADKLESVCRDLQDDYSIYQIYEDIPSMDDDFSKTITRPSAMSFINPKKGSSRTLWCQIEEVKSSPIFDTLTLKQKELQEAKFEIITSEASYLNSLIVLDSQYINNVNFQDEKVLTKIDKQILFSNILPVKKCSERLMAHLETCWQESILLSGLCKIIKDHAEKYFDVYITFCENQIHLHKTMKKLKSDPKFNEIVQNIQSQPVCQSLSLDSFLLIPMQRVTRYPLLIEAVLKRLDETSDEYQMCVDTLNTLNKVVSKCNEGARNMERLEEMFQLYSQIEFPPHIKGFPILSVNERKRKKITERWLIRSGELIQLIWRGEDQSKLTFGRKISRTPIHLFLFTDLLIVTKKKSAEGTFTVIDYCERSLVEMTMSDMMVQPMKETSGKFVVLLTMLENHEKKTMEMLLCCANETDRQRWIEAFSPKSLNPNEKIYEDWDCPQVAALYHYESQQPDELTLYPGDIMNVNKKTAEGWFQGERIRDGESGWFPGNYTKELVSTHLRSRNLKMRYRLLALPGSYLGKDKKRTS